MSNETLGNVRKATVIVAGLGLLVVAGVTKASAAEVNCPRWTTPVCRHWSLGPPATCTEWACVADKQSDGPKTATQGNPTTNPNGPKGNPTPVKTGGSNPGGGSNTPPTRVGGVVAPTGGFSSNPGGGTTTIYSGGKSSGNSNSGNSGSKSGGGGGGGGSKH